MAMNVERQYIAEHGRELFYFECKLKHYEHEQQRTTIDDNLPYQNTLFGGKISHKQIKTARRHHNRDSSGRFKFDPDF